MTETSTIVSPCLTCKHRVSLGKQNFIRCSAVEKVTSESRTQAMLQIGVMVDNEMKTETLEEWDWPNSYRPEYVLRCSTYSHIEEKPEGTQPPSEEESQRAGFAAQALAEQKETEEDTTKAPSEPGVDESAEEIPPEQLEGDSPDSETSPEEEGDAVE